MIKSGLLLVPSVRTKFNSDATVKDESMKEALVALINGIVDELICFQ